MEFDFLLNNLDNSQYENIALYHPENLENKKLPHPFYVCKHPTDNQIIDPNIYARNIDSDKVTNNILDPRPETTALSRPKNLENHPILTKTEDNLKKLKNDCEYPFMPLKADAHIYFKNIDIESRLKNIDYSRTKCKTNNYNQDPSCKDCVLSCYKDILDKDHKVFIPERTPTKCVDVKFPKPCDTKDDQFNINKLDINYRPHADTLYDYSSHKVCDMNCQKIWHNNTKRKGMAHHCEN